MTRRAVPLTAAGLLFAAVAAGLLPVRGDAPPGPRPQAPHPRPAAESPPPDPPADPFPIRRVLVPADQLAALTPPAGGALRRLPRDEFEVLVRAAAKAAAAAGAGPRLVEARYRAALTETGLTGTGEWKVVTAAPGPLSLGPLRVAVWNPRWIDDGTAGAAGRVAGVPPALGRGGRGARDPVGQDALLYRPAAGLQPPTVLWADAGGAVAFDWSARGVEEPGELRFDLRLPPAPVAVLDLDLPAGRVPVPAQSDVLVTGPVPAANPGRAGWRVAFGGQSRVEVTVRAPGGAGQLPPLARTTLSARFDLAPGLADARFEFDLDPVRGPADAWEFEADPALRVTDAVANGRESWRVIPGEPGRPNRLVVKLREPAQGGRVVVAAVAPFPADGQPWACPMVRPAAAAGGEAIELRFGPDLRPEGWDPGDYRTVQAAATPDRGYALTLTGTLAAADAPARRPPAVRATAAGPEFATTEQVEWRIDPARSRLTGRFRVRVLRGPLTQIPFRLPPGFAPEPTGAMPDDPAATAGPSGDGRWVVEPSRPLAAGQTADVLITLRGPPGPPPPDPATAGGGDRVPVPFPQIVPLTAGPREGTYTVVAAPAYRAWPAPTGEPGAGDGTFVYRYVGREPDGVLTLAPRRPRVVVDGDTTVSLTDGTRLVAETRLRPRAEAGEIGALSVFAPDGGWAWDISAAGGATAQPHPAGPLLPWLPALAGSPAVGVAGKLWRVTIPRPAGSGVEVVVRASRPLPSGVVVVPVPVVLGAEQPDLPVSLDPAAAARFDPPAGPDPAGPRLDRTVTLRPLGAAPVAEPSGGWRFADLTLTTRVTDGGAVAGVFAVRVTAAGGGAVPVELPAGADVESATAGGKWATATAADGRVWLSVPDPGAEGVPFELRYRLPQPSGVAFRVESPTPGLPGGAGPVRRVWTAGPGYRLWPTLAAVDEESAADTARVIDARVPEAVGLAAAAVFVGWAAAWLVGGPPGRWGWALLVGAAAGLGAVGWVVPDGWQAVVRPPLVAALAAAVVGAVRRARVRPPAPPAGSRTSALVPLTAAGLLVGWLAAGSVAQAPGPEVVYIVAPAGGPPSVFAPQAVLDRLAALTAPALPAVLVTAAEYDGREVDGTAAFDAKFVVHCTRDGDHVLALPLTGVRLEAMRLDGAAAYPDARPDHLAVTVTGKGRHELTARFAVPVTATGADREARFGVPDVPAGRLTFTLSAAARQATVPTRRGDLTTAGATVRADLGGGRVAAVRWRAGGPAEGRPVASVTEAAVWDVGEDDAGVTAAFVYRVEQGSLARVRVELPPGLEPGRVAVRALDAAAPAGAGNGVKGWALEPAADGWQAFVVTLQTPAEGRVAVTFRLHPRRPPAGRPTLLFPRATEVAAAESYYGVRLDRVTADAWEKAGLIDFPAAAVPPEVAAVPELELERRPLTRAFRREGTAAPQLRPALRPPGEVRPAGHDIVWRLGLTAEAEGTVRWGRDVTLSAGEFDVPAPVAVTDVRAADLAGWSRAGTRVRVWFRAAAREATVRWVGVLNGYPVVPGKPPPDPVAVDLPFPPGADKATTARVRAADGWVVVAQPPAAGREVALAFDPNAPPRVLAYPPLPDRPVRVWQTAEPDGGGVGWRAMVEVGRRANRPLAFTLLVAGLSAGAEPKLELPSGAAAADVEAGGNGAKAWAVTVPAEVPAPFRAAVAVRVPGSEGMTLPAVDVLFAGVPSSRTERWLAVAGDGLRPADRSGVRADAGGWPDDVAKVGGTVWRVAGDEPVRLTAADPAAVPKSEAAPPAPAADPEPDAAGVRLDPDTVRWLLGTGWAVGFAGVAVLVARGPGRLWPEVLVLLGAAAAAAAGPGFLAVSAAGGLARVGWAGRKLARVVLR